MNALALLTYGYVSQIERIVQQLGPVHPEQGQQLLAKALSLPLPTSLTTEAIGIHQSDVIIRTALVAGIADLRANPWLLDFVFKSLARDEMTASEYGEFEIAGAKKWFLKTEIPIVMSDRLDSPEFPCVSIALADSVETEATVGDVHYVPVEEIDAEWPILAGPLKVKKYNPATGIIEFGEKELGDVILQAGQLIIDRAGRFHEILSVVDDHIVEIAAGTVADMTEAVIKGPRPKYMIQVESLNFKETYNVGCHVAAEPVHLTYLHSIVTFLLLRYKQALLEARGFERSTLSSGQFQRNQAFDNEVVYSRFINITGFVRNYWPKAFAEKVGGVSGQFQVGREGTVGPAIDGGQQDPLWLAEQDALLVGIKK